jgi:hypothetical protein
MRLAVSGKVILQLEDIRFFLGMFVGQTYGQTVRILPVLLVLSGLTLQNLICHRSAQMRRKRLLTCDCILVSYYVRGMDDNLLSWTPSRRSIRIHFVIIQLSTMMRAVLTYSPIRQALCWSQKNRKRSS